VLSVISCLPNSVGAGSLIAFLEESMATVGVLLTDRLPETTIGADVLATVTLPDTGSGALLATVTLPDTGSGAVLATVTLPDTGSVVLATLTLQGAPP
jgi:hypothetical protein